INRELGGEFDLRAFAHRAVYNQTAGRVEIYIESTRQQTVAISKLDMQVQFAAGEQIHTENSYKYDLVDIDKLAEATGFTRAQTWQDRAQQFSSNLLLAV
ncbi:MAG TPA: L-histidine N(alpha)-methyltransferase, partial [Pyrinomonadaceae bacterium]